MEGRMNIHERKGRIGKPFLDKIGASKLMNWRQASAGGTKKDLLSNPDSKTVLKCYKHFFLGESNGSKFEII